MLGSHVTVFDTASLLANEDPEASRVLVKKLQDTEVMLYPNTRVERVERSVQGIAVHSTRTARPPSSRVRISSSPRAASRTSNR